MSQGRARIMKFYAVRPRAEDDEKHMDSLPLRDARE